MHIGVPKEIKTHEYRVGLTPASVRELVGHGHQVMIETGAGLGIGASDEDYRRAGARVAEDAETVWNTAEMVVKVKEPLPAEYPFLRADLTLFTFLHLAAAPELARVMLERGCVGIAYETVTAPDGSLPLLAPMSEVAGRMSVQVGAWYLQRSQGGRGILLAGVPGVPPGRVLILGAGHVGRNAARMAAGLGAEVTVLNRSLPPLRQLDAEMPGRLRTGISTREAIEQELTRTDLLIGAVLVPGGRAPTLVTREMVRAMPEGAVIVDVDIDQGGCIETARPTTHAEPVFVEEGVLHYGVSNMPGAVPRTSTLALNAATLPHVLALANKGWREATHDDPHLAHGLNMAEGKVVHPALARALERGEP
ncbi:MAG: alanine dehydrogenase [Pseudomonadota bacterium]